LLPLFGDPKDAVHFRAAAGYIRLAGIKATAAKGVVRPAAATKSK